MYIVVVVMLSMTCVCQWFLHIKALALMHVNFDSLCVQMNQSRKRAAVKMSLSRNGNVQSKEYTWVVFHANGSVVKLHGTLYSGSSCPRHSHSFRVCCQAEAQISMPHVVTRGSLQVCRNFAEWTMRKGCLSSKYLRNSRLHHREGAFVWPRLEYCFDRAFNGGVALSWDQETGTCGDQKWFCKNGEKGSLQSCIETWSKKSLKYFQERKYRVFMKIYKFGYHYLHPHSAKLMSLCLFIENAGADFLICVICSNRENS